MHECMECGKEFEALRSEHNRGGARFCSRECGDKNKRRRTIVTCKQCGIEFEVHNYRLRRDEGKFCSNECSNKWKSENLQGENCPWFGKAQSLEHRKKIGEAISGENHYNWKGGIKSENEKIRNSFEMREWRRAIFERDNYTCQRCLARNGNGKSVYLHANHIIPFSVCPEERFNVDYGATLCDDCHRWIHQYELRV